MEFNKLRVYTCKYPSCKRKNVKLWRKYQTLSDYTSLHCLNHFEKGLVDIYKKGLSDQLGWWVPAIPADDECNSFWGYTSVPQEKVDWWKNLKD